MIKGISFLRPAGSRAVYDRLSSFFSALGFAPGAGWKEETSHPSDEDLSPGTPTSQGASFLAPLGNENGEWFWLVSKDGVPGNEKEKVGPWKCPYHNSRTCFEVMERLNRTAISVPVQTA